MVHSILDVPVALGDLNKGILPYLLPLAKKWLEILYKRLYLFIIIIF